VVRESYTDGGCRAEARPATLDRSSGQNNFSPGALLQRQAATVVDRHRTVRRALQRGNAVTLRITACNFIACDVVEVTRRVTLKQDRVDTIIDHLSFERSAEDV
jgi:hypothetical protein